MSVRRKKKKRESGADCIMPITCSALPDASELNLKTDLEFTICGWVDMSLRKGDEFRCLQNIELFLQYMLLLTWMDQVW